MITGRGTSEVLRDVDETVMIIRNTERVHKPGKLFIKKMPEGGTTVNTLRAYMKELQIKTGLKPDALVIDYLDLMYSTNPRIDPSDQFIKDKYVSEEIRGLMHETNTIGATASQLNRSSFDAERYDHSHIAGGISKINTADNVFGIVSSFSMKEKGIYKLQFLKTRSSSAVGQEIELGYDSKSMRITDPVMVEDMDKMFSKDDLQKMMKADPKSSKHPEIAEAESAQTATEHPVIADLRDLAFKLRSHMETDDNADLAMGIEQGFERAADMIENLIRRHTESGCALT
ncbi:unnamed protein product [Sphagnum tenellum]